MLSIYKQIVDLREFNKPREKGYKFEQLVREIQPWDVKPAITVSTDSEQFDGVFTKNGITYIIESKAKGKKITQGDKDWEDYELKIRRRCGHGVIGIFCSLNPVNKSVYDAGNRLNQSGFFNIILAGDVWEQLLESNLDFGLIIEYMVQYIRTKGISKPPPIKDIFEWMFEKDEVARKINDFCNKESGPFLRRFKHKHHANLYVGRGIDTSINNLVNQLKPNILRTKHIGHKEIPKQFVVVRDYSGSGKTTFSVELASAKKDYPVIGLSANYSSIDMKIENFFTHSNNYCINELKTINSPIVFVIDSLDEVYTVQEKKNEIKAIFRRVEELNEFSNSLGYLCYPILVVYTVRDDYYRTWEASFEGRHEVIDKKKVISSFNEDEFNQAISKYQNIYNYRIENQLSLESKEILSVPINLAIFSYTNEYEGDIIVTDIWEGKIIQSYFDRKLEDFNKHLILGVNKEIYINILSLLAIRVTELKDVSFEIPLYNELIRTEFKSIEHLSESILQLLESEQILIRDKGDSEKLRFRYLRFLEYLSAYYAVSSVYKKGDVLILDRISQTIFESGFLSMFKVFDNIKHIAKKEFENLQVLITEYFQNSEAFMSKKLPMLRGSLSNGISTNRDDLKMLLGNSFSASPQLTWDAFFVVAAKLNRMPPKTILDTFLHAWNTNGENANRWRLLVGIVKNDLLLNEEVFRAILKSLDAKEWEVYLGFIFERKLNFKDIGVQDLFEKKINDLIKKNLKDWSQVHLIFTAIINDELTIPESSKVKKTIKKTDVNLFHLNEDEISDEKKKECINILDEIENTYFKSNLSGYLHQPKLPFMDDELVYFNKVFNTRFSKYYGKERRPFLNYLVANSKTYNAFLSFLYNNPQIDCDILGFDIERRTLFQEVYLSDAYNKHSSYEYLVKRKYPKRKNDDDFLASELEKNPFNEQVYLSKFYYDTSKPIVANQIHVNEKIICTLLSLKHKIVIGYKLPNIISVVNNALSHYKSNGDIIIKALKYYNLYEDLLAKPSFQKKEAEMNLSQQVFDRSSDELFIELFPELF